MSDHHPRNDHERTDAKVKPLFYAALVLAAITALSMAAMVWLFDFLDSRNASAARERSPLADTVERPAAPKLQARPIDEIDLLRRSQTSFLEDYAWVDPEQGVVRIPVERAIEIISEKQLLPVREQSPAPSQGGAGAAPRGEAAADSSGGNSRR